MDFLPVTLGLSGRSTGRNAGAHGCRPALLPHPRQGSRVPRFRATVCLPLLSARVDLALLVILHRFTSLARSFSLSPHHCARLFVSSSRSRNCDHNSSRSRIATLTLGDLIKRVSLTSCLQFWQSGAWRSILPRQDAIRRFGLRLGDRPRPGDGDGGGKPDRYGAAAAQQAG